MALWFKRSENKEHQQLEKNNTLLGASEDQTCMEKLGGRGGMEKGSNLGCKEQLHKEVVGQTTPSHTLLGVPNCDAMVGDKTKWQKECGGYVHGVNEGHFWGTI